MSGRLCGAVAVVCILVACGGPEVSSSPAASTPPASGAGSSNVDTEPIEDCGIEVRDCDLGELTPVDASCERSSYEYAIYSNIDQRNFPFEVIGCNERYLTLRVDLGDCLPETSEEQREECARRKTAYFRAKRGLWRLLTYESQTRCSFVQSLDPAFPNEFCRASR